MTHLEGMKAVLQTLKDMEVKRLSLAWVCGSDVCALGALARSMSTHDAWTLTRTRGYGFTQILFDAKVPDSVILDVEMLNCALPDESMEARYTRVVRGIATKIEELEKVQ